MARAVEMAMAMAYGHGNAMAESQDDLAMVMRWHGCGNAMALPMAAAFPCVAKPRHCHGRAMVP